MSSKETNRTNSAARRRQGLGLASLLILLILAFGVALSARTSRSDEARTLTLTARDMAFYVEGDPTPNPTLTVRRGEIVRLVLVNQDLGMTHDLAIEPLDVATPALRSVGAKASVVFEAPAQPGTSEYVCTYHDKMMRGVLRVE